MENGLSPGREEQSSARRENLRKSVTLSDVKAPVGPGDVNGSLLWNSGEQ